MSSDLPGMGGDFAKGVSGGVGGVYDTSPAGLGLSPAYLGQGATASANSASGSATVSATKPSSPVDTQQWVYLDSTNHFAWHFVFQSSDSYWYFIGGHPWVSVDTSGVVRQNTADATWEACGGVTAFSAPFAGDYTATFGAGQLEVTNTSDSMQVGLSINAATPAQPILLRQIAADAGVADFSPVGAAVTSGTLAVAQTFTVKIKSSTHANVQAVGPFLSVIPKRVQ